MDYGTFAQSSGVVVQRPKDEVSKGLLVTSVSPLEDEVAMEERQRTEEDYSGGVRASKETASRSLSRCQG